MAALQTLRAIATRPPLTTIDRIRATIETNNIPPYNTVRLRLCLLSAEVFNEGRGIHADFVDEDISQVFADFNTEFAQVSRAQRVRFIFRLTIWSPRNGPPLNLGQFPFPPGSVLELNQVANLSSWKSLCQGTSELAHIQQFVQPNSNQATTGLLNASQANTNQANLPFPNQTNAVQVNAYQSNQANQVNSVQPTLLQANTYQANTGQQNANHAIQAKSNQAIAK